MSLRFIYGRSGSGKTDYCIASAAEIKKRTYIIVPEQYSHMHEAILARRLGVFGAEGPCVMSFNQLARDILKTADGAASPHIDRGGKTMLLCDIINKETKNLTLLAGRDTDRARAVRALISEMKRYGISAEALKNAADKERPSLLKSKLSETALIYGKFEEALSGRFINSDDNLTRAALYLQSRGFDCGGVYLNAFASFTPSELSFIKTLMTLGTDITVTLEAHENECDSAHFLPLSKTRAALLAAARETGTAVLPSEALPERARQTKEMAFLAEKYFDYSSQPYKDEPCDIEIFEARTPYTEAVHAASRILRLCREESYAMRDIGIICGNTDLYAPYIKSVFSKYDIPVFTDLKLPLSEHPAGAFIVSALDVITSGYSRTAVFRYAKSGFTDTDIAETDILENYVLAAGIRGDAWKSEEKWNMRSGLYRKSNISKHEEQEIELTNEIRKKLITPVLSLASALAQGKTCAEKCRALYEFMCTMNFSAKCSARADELEMNGEAYRAAEFRAASNKIVDVLDEAADALGGEKMSVSRFADIITAGITESEIGLIPSLADGVPFGDSSRVKGYDVSALFILGANDGSFPPLPAKSSFLSDADRTAMKKNGIILAPDSKEQTLENDYLIYKALSSPGKKLFISYAGSDFDGSTKLPSLFVNRVKEVFPRLIPLDDIMDTLPDDRFFAPEAAFRTILSRGGTDDLRQIKDVLFKKMPVFKASYENAIGGFEGVLSIDPKDIEKLFGSHLTTSVSRLETFSSCPFSYYMKYTLSAKEREKASLSFSDAGSFLHDFTEEFSNRLHRNGSTWHDVDENYVDAEIPEIMQIMDSRLNKYILSESPRAARLFIRLCKTIREALLYIAEQINRGSFEPLGYEISFGENGRIKPLTVTLPTGQTVSLTGKIDRADLLKHGEDTFVRIIDYKSGSKTFKLEDLFGGITLQLAVYLTALCENDKSGKTKPAGMLYFKLDDPVTVISSDIGDEEIRARKMKALSVSGLLTEDGELLSEMDKTGKFDLLPVNRTQKGFSGSLASAQNFEDMSKFIKKTVTRLSGEIFCGKCAVSPDKSADPCKYCPYITVCRRSDSSYRERKACDNIWLEIAKEGKDEI